MNDDKKKELVRVFVDMVLNTSDEELKKAYQSPIFNDDESEIVGQSKLLHGKCDDGRIVNYNVHVMDNGTIYVVSLMDEYVNDYTFEFNPSNGAAEIKTALGDKGVISRVDIANVTLKIANSVK